MSPLLIFTMVVLVFAVGKARENFAWSCTFTPNVDYYKGDWLLGGNAAGEAMARDAIKSPLNF